MQKLCLAAEWGLLHGQSRVVTVGCLSQILVEGGSAFQQPVVWQLLVRIHFHAVLCRVQPLNKWTRLQPANNAAFLQRLIW
jgi:hypothetical protein